jgi:hypothetical protein
MSTQSGRIFLTLGGLLAVMIVISLSIASILPSGGAGAVLQQEIQEPESFKFGAESGHERAGFSGRPMLEIFASPEDPSWPALFTLLQSPEVQAAMDGFTGILVDERQDPDVEKTRRAEGYQVIARSLSGAYLGGLKSGFTSRELGDFLQALKASHAPRIEKSPIYNRLLESPEEISEVLLKQGRPRAERLSELLEEFAGPENEAVVEVKARLAP